MRIAAFLGVAAVLVGCASSTHTVGDAATTPLRDLNVVRAPIPSLLVEAQAAPYAVPAARSCRELADAVKALDGVLGPDLDAPPPDKATLAERGQAEAGKALVRTAEGVVPFRGWIRKLSGAERYAREVERAIQSGEARRAFLRGLASGLGC